MLLILLGIIATCCIILWALSSPFYWRRRGVPYLFPLPLFGNNLPSFTTSLANFYDKLYNNYPNEKYFGFHFFIRPTLLVKDPTLLKDIYIKDFEYFSTNAMYANEETDPFGGNMLCIHGQQWKEIRTKLGKHFTPSKLRVIHEYVENSMERANKCITDKVNIKEPIEIDKLCVVLTTHIVFQAILGIETDNFQKISKFLELAKKMLGSGTNIRLIMSIVSPELNDLLKINIFDKEVTTFLKNVLEDVIKYRENNNINKNDFVNAMMNMMKIKRNGNDKEKYFADKTKVPDYDFKTVFAQILVLVGGGVDPSAMTMAFFLYEASLNQDIQEKCREEVMSVINETGTDIRPEDVSKLTYLDMALKETIRKYPPVLITSRICTKSYKLRDSNVTIDPGTVILTPIRSIQWDPKYFPNPEEFIPERFSVENKGSIDSGTYVAWGLGPRTCFGKWFAKLEMFLVISRLLRDYRFTVSSKTDVPVKIYPYRLITSPNPGIWLDVHPISKAS